MHTYNIQTISFFFFFFFYHLAQDDSIFFFFGKMETGKTTETFRNPLIKKAKQTLHLRSTYAQVIKAIFSNPSGNEEGQVSEWNLKWS